MLGIRATISALAVAACATAIGACGNNEEGTIPTDSGREMLALLNQVESEVEAGDCAAARESAVQFASFVDELPAEVGDELREEMVAASSNLVELADEQCEDAAPVGPTGETGATDEGEPPPTETAPETPEAETPDPSEEEDEGDDDDNPGNGPPSGNPGGGNAGGDDSSGGIGSGG